MKTTINLIVLPADALCLHSGLDASSFLDKHIDQLKKQRVAAALAAINRRHMQQAKGLDAEAASNAAAAAAGG
jgi:hypothetical protein